MNTLAPKKIRMKFIINTSNLQSGGALQVALSLLEEWQLLGKDNEYHIFLSPQLEQLLAVEKFDHNFHFYHFKKNPTHSFFTPFTFYKKLKKLEAAIHPDAVFTVFGPALWTPNSPHLVGFANGYYLRDDSFFIQKKVLNDFSKRLKYYARRYVLFHQLKKEANHYWVETDKAKELLSATINKPLEGISVVGNTYASSFKNTLHKKNKTNKTFNLLFVSAYYEHKNFEIIGQIIPILKQKNIECSIITTLATSEFQELFHQQEDKEYLNNRGPIHPQETYKIYAEADALFMPSLLETFSANYPEAMKMELPIICSDFDFSRDICGDAALYFDAQNPQDIADKIIALIGHQELQQQLVATGKKRLEALETPESRAQKLLNLLTEIAQLKNSRN